MKAKIRFQQFERVALAGDEVLPNGIGNPPMVAVENFAHQFLMSARQIVG
jgi:hypothetical protein